MKILVLGHGQHGKGTVAQIISDLIGLTFCSSSVFAFEMCIWPELCHEYLDRNPFSPDAKVSCYQDRHNRQQEWFDLIAAYCVPKDRLAKELLEKFDIYDGMRSLEEFEASKRLFDHIIWVDREQHQPLDPSMEIDYTDVIHSGRSTWIINNNRTLLYTCNQVKSFVEYATP